MKATEFGTDNKTTMMLLPGTSCTWEINFNMLTEPLSEKYHVIYVNYTGFDGENDIFDTQTKGFFETIRKVDHKSVTNQFYSDLVTKLDDGINVPGTTIHVFHSEKMGEKYLKRYRKHYADPDIIPFDCGHEGWLGNPEMMIDTFDIKIGRQKKV